MVQYNSALKHSTKTTDLNILVFNNYLQYNININIHIIDTMNAKNPFK